MEALCEHDAKYHAVSQTLEPQVRAGRVHALTLLEAGTPIEKMNNLNFRTAMEAAFKVPMTGASHLRELVPVVRIVQQKKLGEECTKDLQRFLGWDDQGLRGLRVYRQNVDSRARAASHHGVPLSCSFSNCPRASRRRYGCCAN